jgi:uncharacterized membrane protein YgdD (TMEM256/DUF423 family)
MCGAISAGIGVGCGAFGAHSLRNTLTAEMLATFETSARYQMYHAFALMITALAAKQWGAPGISKFRLAGWSFALGTVLFSGSLYLLSVTGERWLGAITPFGGVAFLTGWGALAWAIWSSHKNRDTE